MKRHLQTLAAGLLVCALALAADPARGRFGSPGLGSAEVAAAAIAATGWTSDGATTVTTQNVRVGNTAATGSTLSLYADPNVKNHLEFRNPGSSTLWGYIYSDETLATLVTGAFKSESAKVRGTITLAAGTGTATVLTGAKCVCGTETANAVRCSVAATTLTCTGTGTDACNYLCL